MIGIEAAGNIAAAPLGIEIADPAWLTAIGHPQRVEVLRSPLVDDTIADYARVLRYIADHGLVLADRETYDDDRWVFGSVEMSVYTSPAARNSTYAVVAI